MSMKILVISNIFLPGVNGGGPIKSLKNLLDFMINDNNFFVLTKSRDIGCKERYKDIEVNKWIKKDNYLVKYVDLVSTINLVKDIQRLKPDVVYINSFFSQSSISTYFLINFFKNIKFIVAPRGELNQNALSLKRTKKKIFIKTIKSSKLLNNVEFHATSLEEKKDIQKYFPNNVITLISNLPSKTIEKNRVINKKQNSLKIVSISRVSKMKNIFFGIELLKEIKSGIVTYDIYGPIEDEDYYEQCISIISNLPSNINVNFKGSISNDDVPRKLAEYDLFFSPTLGENYGHSIIEAIQQKVPVLISDNTPWRNLDDKHVGKDINLNDKSSFVNYIIHLLEMDNNEYKNQFNGFDTFEENELNIDDTLGKYQKLFTRK